MGAPMIKNVSPEVFARLQLIPEEQDPNEPESACKFLDPVTGIIYSEDEEIQAEDQIEQAERKHTP